MTSKFLEEHFLIFYLLRMDGNYILVEQYLDFNTVLLL